MNEDSSADVTVLQHQLWLLKVLFIALWFRKIMDYINMANQIMCTFYLSNGLMVQMHVCYLGSIKNNLFVVTYRGKVAYIRPLQIPPR